MRNSVFSNNATKYADGAVYLKEYAFLDMAKCHFYRNYGESHGDRGGAAVALANKGSNLKYHLIDDTHFEENKPYSRCISTLVLSENAMLKITNSRFSKNNCSGNKPEISFVSSSIATTYGAKLFASGCYFADNGIKPHADSNKSFGGVVIVDNGNVTLLNCTFESNGITNPGDSNLPSATIYAKLGNVAVVNCLFDGSDLGEKNSEIANVGANVSIINSILRNGASAYKPLSYAAGRVPCIKSSIISNYDESALPSITGNGYLENAIDAAVDLAPLANKGGNLYSRRLLGYRYAALGIPVWQSDCTVWFRDEAKPSTPWRSTLNMNTFSAAVNGITADSPVIPDAFGNPRKKNRVAPGPLNLPNPSTILKMR